ncbi:MAG: WD40 repeat protein [Myxococcota bacterium]
MPPEVLGKELDSQVSPRDTVPSIAFVPGQQLLAGVTLTGLITFWNLETGTIVVNRSIGLPAMAVAFSDDGGTLALGAESGATAVVALDAGFGEIPNP